MSDNIYEIAKMMQNKNILQEDLNEAINLITGHFQKKYTNKIYDVLQHKQQEFTNNPNEHVKLLNALKPFMPETQRPNIDKTINMLIMFDTINSIKSEINPNQNKNISSPNFEKRVSSSSLNMRSKDSAIHEDGIYEFDNKCLQQESFKKKENNFVNELFLIFIMLCR